MYDTADGSTRGPVDMSVTIRLYLTELPLAHVCLPEGEQTRFLRIRLMNAYNDGISQGEAVVTLTFSPAEQGLLMGCLRDATCRFSGGLRWRLQQAMVAKLLELGAPTDL